MMLTGLKKADVAIVGGGLTGLLLGASLAHEGMKVAIVEAGDGGFPLPREAATAHLAPQYQRILHAYDSDTARLYAGLLQGQLGALLAAPLPYVQRMPLYTYAMDKAHLPALEAHHTLYTQLHLPSHIAPDAGGCPFPVELSLCTPDQVLVDVPRWTAALTGSIRRSGGHIYTNSRVMSFDRQRICTGSGCVIAPICVLTTGIPLGFQNALYLECRTRIHCLLAGAGPLHSLQQPVQEDGLSLCPTPFGLAVSLYAGRCGTHQQQAHLAHAEERIRRLLPDGQQGEIHCSRQVLTADGLPLIGMLPDSPRLCAAGVESIPGAMHAASVLTRHILGRAHPEDALFSPARRLPSAVLQRAKRRSAAIRAASWLRFSAPACAHCGCRMRYTAPLSLWECPLCATAYTLLGQPVNGPGMTPAEVSPRQRPIE